MSDITIKEVSAKKDFREFLRFPYSLFKDDKMWVPPLIADEKTTFNKKKILLWSFAITKSSWHIETVKQ